MPSSAAISAKRTRSVTDPVAALITPKQDGPPDLDQEKMALEASITDLRKQLEEKENVIETSAMIGKQLVSENDKLEAQINELTKEINKKDEKIIEQEKKIVILSDESLQFENEANDFHKELITANQEIERLKDDIVYLEKINSQKNNPKQNLNNFDPQQMQSELDRLQNQNQVLEQCLKEEQKKFQAMLQKAEEKARDNLKIKRISAQLEEQNAQLVNEKNELENKLKNEINRFKERISNLQIDNEELMSQLNEQQHYLDVAQDEIHSLKSHSINPNESNNLTPLQRLSSTRRTSNITIETELDELEQNNLQFMGYFDENDNNIANEIHDSAPQSEELNVIHSVKFTQQPSDPQNEQIQNINFSTPKLVASISADSNSPLKNAENIENLENFENQKHTVSGSNDEPSSNSNISHTPSIQIDAMEEYIKLSILAAKIKFRDVTVSTQNVRRLIEVDKVQFHNISDWLNNYMIQQRRIQNSPPKPIQTQISHTKQQPQESAKAMFQRLFEKTKALVVGDATNSEISLDVHYKKRRFEVSLREKDSLRTIAYCLPMFDGRNKTQVEDIAFVVGARVLDADKSIQFNKLKDGSGIRLLHRRHLQSYFKKLDSRNKLTNSESFKDVTN